MALEWRASALPQLCIVSVADKANGGERSLLLAVTALSNILDESGHQLRPLMAGYLYGGDG